MKRPTGSAFRNRVTDFPIVVILLVLVATGCARIDATLRPSAAPSGSPATPTIPTKPTIQPSQLTPALTPPAGDENVALRGTATASRGQSSAENAIDANPNNAWSAGDYPVQWFMVTLDKFYLVDRIELAITLAPAGKTSHEVWIGDASGSLTLFKQLTNVDTVDGQTFVIPVDPPQPVDRVLIRTTSGPSFVAWKNVRVFGKDVPATIPTPVAASGTAGWIDWPTLALTGGFDLPVQVTNAGDGSGRMFVVEQRGTIRV
ncbi:MAG TPA: discoidin domain-containing protein, partial [Chloroflexota bacterium]|nr:discoidin domain-containing protein [Chloroflexota bacterium]